MNLKTKLVKNRGRKDEAVAEVYHVDAREYYPMGYVEYTDDEPPAVSPTPRKTRTKTTVEEAE